LPRVLHLAPGDGSNHRGLTSVPRALPVGARGAAVTLVLLAALAAPLAVAAADPTPDPGATARPPTCSERFAEEGPAGVDLRLGCTVSEVIGLYTAGQDASPPPLSSYAIALGILTIGVVILVILAGRFVGRRAGERLAPVLADEWWVCASCRSVNGAGVTRCYSCGATRPDGPTLRTDAAPTTSQSFGSSRKRG
jgi:hypothetical protein